MSLNYPVGTWLHLGVHTIYNQQKNWNTNKRSCWVDIFSGHPPQSIIRKNFFQGPNADTQTLGRGAEMWIWTVDKWISPHSKRICGVHSMLVILLNNFRARSTALNNFMFIFHVTAGTRKAYSKLQGKEMWVFIIRAEYNYLYVEWASRRIANHHFHPFPLWCGINLIQKASSNLCLLSPSWWMSSSSSKRIFYETEGVGLMFHDTSG